MPRGFICLEEVDEQLNCSYVQAHCGLNKGAYSNLHLEAAAAPVKAMLPSVSKQRARETMYGKNDLALQLFFPQDNTVHLILLLLCSFVFPSKILTVLECLYFIKCVLFFGYHTLELL